MNENKLRLIFKILIGVLIVYSVLLNVKYSQNLMDLFTLETYSLYDSRDSIKAIDEITYNREVSNDFKNTVISNEKKRLTNIGSWFLNLDRYTIADRKIKNLSIDVSDEILKLVEAMNNIKEKDIKELNEVDKKALSEYKVFLQSLSENSMKINETIKEDVVIPVYTRSHIEEYIFNIGNAILD